jgi:hypothetical protein
MIGVLLPQVVSGCLPVFHHSRRRQEFYLTSGANSENRRIFTVLQNRESDLISHRGSLSGGRVSRNSSLLAPVENDSHSQPKWPGVFESPGRQRNLSDTTIQKEQGLLLVTPYSKYRIEQPGRNVANFPGCHPRAASKIA